MRRRIYYRLLLQSLILGVTAWAVMPAQGETIANFAGGDSSTVVDAWPGKAGGGWAGAWIEYSSYATYTVGTTNTAPQVDPISDTGIYVDISMTPTRSSSPGRYGSVARDYTAGIDVTKSHTIEFKYRVDEDIDVTEDPTFTTSTDRYQLFDTYDTSQATAGANCSWIIGIYGGSATWLSASKVGHWVVYNGANDGGGFLDSRNVDTGIDVTPGVIYDFCLYIDMDPVVDDGDPDKTWDVVIHGDDGSSYDSRVPTEYPQGLGWRCADPTVGGLPHFATYGDNTSDTREHSLDTIRIVPEPSMLVLIVALSMLGLIRRSR